MNTGVIGSCGPRIRVDKRCIEVAVSSGDRKVIETIRVANDGRGQLKGVIASDALWIRVISSTINTAFLQNITVEIDPAGAVKQGTHSATIGLITNGGSVQIPVNLRLHPESSARLVIDSPSIQLCNLSRGEVISTDLVIKNSGNGFLSGSVTSLSDWIEVTSRTIWTKTLQNVRIRISTVSAPSALHPVGRVLVKTNGGSREVCITLGFSKGARPKVRTLPEQLRVSCPLVGIFEEKLLIFNEGAAVLRGTIPSIIPGVSAVPAIFSTDPGKVSRIIVRVDSRKMSQMTPCSLSLQIITNTGVIRVPLEIIRTVSCQVKRPVQVRRRNRLIKRQKRITVYTPDGEPLILSSSGKSGGEGEIWYCSDSDKICVKTFHPHRITPVLEEKVLEMVSSPPGPLICASTTWPKVPVTDKPSGGRFLGYLMNRVPEKTYKSAHVWYDRPADQKEFHIRIKAAEELATTVAALHAAGHAIGDLRENNILISEEGRIVLIDTDSFQIQSKPKAKTYYCRVGTGEYLPPEILDGEFAQQDIDRKYSDRFALAVLIFRMLMDGVHPYQAKGALVADAPSTTDKIRLGFFAFEGEITGLEPPEYAPPYCRIPDSIRSLFYDAFVYGHGKPEKRPDAQRWKKVLGTHSRTPEIQIFQKTETVSPLPIKKEIILPKYLDLDGNPLKILDTIGKIRGGYITQTNKSGFLAVFFNDTYNSRIIGIPEANLPSAISWVIPAAAIHRNDDRLTTCGFLIPEFDLSRYRPWHMVSDPETRKKISGFGFSFRHQIATCRNLVASLLSMQQVGLYPLDISEQSVFVGPDTMVKIFCGKCGDGRSKNWLLVSQAASVLIFRMLMDGFHPFQSVRYKHYILKSHGSSYGPLFAYTHQDGCCMPPPCSPDFGKLPVPLKKMMIRSFEEKIPVSINEWFHLLNGIFHMLVQCPLNPDHWYLKDEWCPFCYPSGISLLLLQTKKSVFSLPVRSFPFLLTGKSTAIRERRIRRLSRIKKRNIADSTLYSIIFLNSGVPCNIQLPVFSLKHLCSYETDVSTGLISHQPAGKAMTWVSPGPVVVYGDLRRFEVMMRDRWQLPLPDISFIDEMVWYSAIDQFKGEGLSRIYKKKRLTGRKRIKNPIQIMLYPIDLSSLMVPIDTVHVEKTRRKRKRSIRKKIQTIIEDFIG